MFHCIIVLSTPKEPNDDISNFATLPLNKSLKTKEMTICLQFETFVSDPLNWRYFFRDTITDFRLRTKFTQEYGFFHMDKVLHIFSIPGNIFHPFSWFHFCLSLNQTHYQIVSQGKLWYSFKRYQTFCCCS